jgi:hypothetical protein
VQHGLPHREFVEIGVEQAGDDGSHGAMLGKRNGARAGVRVWPLQVEFLAGGQPQSAGLHGC